jgi:hypothetical protein
MHIDYEFLKNVILILIPTVIGIISSKFIINSWQMRKEKFTIKKEILQEFDSTIPKSRHNIQRFFWLLDAFLKNESNNTGEHIEKEYESFLNEHKQIFDRISNFKSSLMLFFDEELLTKYVLLIEKMDSATSDLEKMYKNKNNITSQNEFKFSEILGTMQRDYDAFRKLLIKSKLKDPIV